MKRLQATFVLTLLLVSSLALLVPAPATAGSGPITPHSTTDRTVLVELFTGANCGPCVNVDRGLEAFMETYDRTEVAALVYHRSIPTADMLETTETINRHSFYLPPGEGGSTPNYWVDGTNAAVGGFTTSTDGEAWFQGKYDVQSVNASQLSIDLDAHIAPNKYGKVWVNVSALENPDYANLYLHVALVREYYGPWDGGNHVVDHYYTVRKMLGGAAGEAFVITPTAPVKKEYEFDLSSDSITDYQDMAVVAFVQTHSKTVVTSEVYPRSRYIAPILQSKFATVRTIPNVAPVISSGHVEMPNRTTPDDDVTFKVFYQDPDDKPGNGPGEATVEFKNETQQVFQQLLSPVASANTWIEGRWLSYTTRLEPGTYSYRFSATDGFDPASGDTDWNATTFVVKPRNKVPQLMDPSFAPFDGDTRTVFTFDIMYRDEDNEKAVSAKIYINGMGHDMETVATGPWNEWQMFSYETTLPVGSNHKFYFVLSDGIDEVRYPAIDASPNWILGPEVAPPNNEPYLTTPLFNPSTGTRMDEFTFTIIYTDTEDDRPITSYIYIDGTPQIMDGEGDYSAGVTFSYTTKLGLGAHLVHFLFSDGTYEVSYPPAGEMDGPTITNMAPAAVIASPANRTRFTPEDFITFSAAGSSDPEGDKISYKWVSDKDGNIGESQLVDRQLSENWHNVTLTVTDANGGVATKTINLNVKAYRAAPFFEDYTKNIEMPMEKDTVRYTVFLGNSGEKTATGVPVSFLVDNTYVDSEAVTVAVGARVEVKFTWVAEAGEHSVAIELPGDRLLFTEYVDANPRPTAEPIIINEGDAKGRYKVSEELYFKAQATDPNGDKMTYAWDFGDGITSTKADDSHIYATPGTYTVTLTITDARGGQTVETFTVEVAKPETSDGAGSSMLMVGGIIAAIVVVIIVVFVMMTRGRGGKPEEAAPVQEEPRPDVPDYLLPDPKPVRAPTHEEHYPGEQYPVEEEAYPDYSGGLPEDQPEAESNGDGYLGY